MATNLTGWMPEGPAPVFSAEKGELIVSGRGNLPHWIRTGREYEDFRLSFEYRLARWAEAAVILRAPREGRPARAGIALYLAHDFHDMVTPYTTGGIPGALPPQRTLKPDFGVWHKAGVLLHGDRLRATIDGVVVQDVDLAAHPELRYRLKRGYIGFPDLGYAYRLRNLEIEDLGGGRRFVPLFDGSLSDWGLRGEGTWSVRDGAIVSSNGHGILYAPGEFDDFELTALVRSRGRANGGIFLRGFPAGRERGFENQIYSPVDSV